MSKSMKKNFDSVGKALKDAEAREKRRRPSVGSATHSTRVNLVTVEMLREKEKEHIFAILSGQYMLCMKLNLKTLVLRLFNL